MVPPYLFSYNVEIALKYCPYQYKLFLCRFVILISNRTKFWHGNWPVKTPNKRRFKK
jgi:hypothetical protein